MTVRRVLMTLLGLGALAFVAAIALGSGGPAPRAGGVAFCTQGPDVPAAARAECAEEGRELTEPADALLDRVTFGSEGKVPTDIFKRASREARASQARTRQAFPRVAAAQWSFIGPSNIGGRILDIALDPDDEKVIYSATAGGGLMVSRDRGVTLESLWPDDFPQATSSVVMTPKGILYVGTGEAGPGGGSLTYAGDGVYRSDDRGKNWRRLKGLESTSRIGRIVLDPKDERRIWVAGTGNLFKGTADRGVYLSEDGGDSFKLVLKGDNPTTGAVDIAVDPKDPKRVIAAMWDHIRTPQQRNYTGIGSGMFRTLDAGRTWTRISPVIAGPDPTLGRIGLAIDPENPDIVYANASGGVGGHVGFFKSMDFGTTFLRVISPMQAGLSGSFTYGWWFGRTWVDPRNSQNVFVAGLDLLRSTDAGLTFNPRSAGMHVDQHALVWDPRKAGRMYAGNDGGLYRSEDDGATWTQAKVQPFSQPDALDVSEQDPKRIVAGLQDNGEIRNYAAKNGDYTEFGPGGDGQRVLINPKDKNIVYACGQNGACQVSRDGGNSGTSFENTVISARKAFFMPIEFDPAEPNRIYTGGEIMNRSDDDAENFTPISPDLSDGPDTNELNPLYNGRGALSAIGSAPRSSGRLYAGTDDGNLWYADAGTDNAVGIGDWVRAADPDLPDAFITRIEVDPKDAKIAYVTYSGFRSGDNAAYVLKTTDGGKAWTNITGDLPKAPVNDINIVDDYLVVASDFGVYASRNGGTNWYRIGRDLPLAPIYEMRVHKPSQQLFVATFGRSLWKIPLGALDGLQLAENLPAAVPGKPARIQSLPRNRSCRSGARYRLRVRVIRATAKRVTISVNRKRVRTLTGRKVGRTVVLKLPRKRTRVAVGVTTTDGKRLSTTRTYRACR